ncbi:hypothetical protein [Nocardioides sp. WS12]|uniref:hypothetical protein n=1 Tax=Nocardioides sp. WS12 TaxID=2486272 RepID=UPI0015FBE614|nr:hypothetical protein [Nocardioides sp. WS12]
MANPIEAIRDFLVADAPNHPAGTAKGTKHPAAPTLDHVVIQYGWDGTPSDADNREDVALRITVWAPRGEVTEASTVAGGIRSRLLDHSSALIQRVDRGSGRIPGIDPDTGLPFCTFTVNAVLVAL